MNLRSGRVISPISQKYQSDNSISKLIQEKYQDFIQFKNSPPEILNYFPNSLFYISAWYGLEDICIEMVKSQRVDLSENSCGASLFIHSIENRMTKVIQELLKNNIKLSLSDIDYMISHDMIDNCQEHLSQALIGGISDDLTSFSDTLDLDFLKNKEDLKSVEKIIQFIAENKNTIRTKIIQNIWNLITNTREEIDKTFFHISKQNKLYLSNKYRKLLDFGEYVINS